jgi:hypothetical protein
MKYRCGKSTQRDGSATALQGERERNQQSTNSTADSAESAESAQPNNQTFTVAQPESEAQPYCKWWAMILDGSRKGEGVVVKTADKLKCAPALDSNKPPGRSNSFFEESLICLKVVHNPFLSGRLLFPLSSAS